MCKCNHNTWLHFCLCFIDRIHTILSHNIVCTKCTYLGTKIDQSGDNTTEMKHRISQTRKAINALNFIYWHKNITKNRQLYIYQTMIQSILVYGAEVWLSREHKRLLVEVVMRSLVNFNTCYLFFTELKNTQKHLKRKTIKTQIK